MQRVCLKTGELLSRKQNVTENFNQKWVEQKNLFAQHEAEQESRVFMSDPDLFLKAQIQTMRSGKSLAEFVRLRVICVLVENEIH